MKERVDLIFEKEKFQIGKLLFYSEVRHQIYTDSTLMLKYNIFFTISFSTNKGNISRKFMNSRHFSNLKTPYSSIIFIF